MLDKFITDIKNGNAQVINNIYQLIDYYNIIKDNIIKSNNDITADPIGKIITDYNNLYKDDGKIYFIIKDNYLKLGQTNSILDANYINNYISSNFELLLNQYNIQPYKPFKIYEELNYKFIINIKGNIFKILHCGFSEDINIYNNGLAKIITDNWHIKSLTPPKFGEKYFYKSYNFNTKQIEIICKKYTDQLDWYNFIFDNCFASSEYCEKFCTLTKDDLLHNFMIIQNN